MVGHADGNLLSPIVDVRPMAREALAPSVHPSTQGMSGTHPPRRETQGLAAVPSPPKTCKTEAQGLSTEGKLQSSWSWRVCSEEQEEDTSVLCVQEIKGAANPRGKVVENKVIWLGMEMVCLRDKLCRMAWQ